MKTRIKVVVDANGTERFYPQRTTWFGLRYRNIRTGYSDVVCHDRAGATLTIDKFLWQRKRGKVVSTTYIKYP